MSPASTILSLLTVGALSLAASAALAVEAAEVHAVAKAACLPPNETREEIKAHHLLEPFAVLKSAASPGFPNRAPAPPRSTRPSPEDLHA